MMNTSTATSDGKFKVANITGGTMRSDLQKQWMARPHDERFTSLDELKQSVLDRAARCTEDRLEAKRVEFFAPTEIRTVEDTHPLMVGLPDGTEVAPTHWSFGQLAQLAKAPAGYLRTLPSQIVADAMSYGLRFNRGVSDIKLYGEPGAQLRAATGPEYGRIYDHEVVEAVQQIAGNGTGDTRWKIPGTMDWRTMVYDPHTPVTKDSTTLYASDRDVFMFLVDDLNPIEVGKTANGDPDLMFRGFYVKNSEVGSAPLVIAAFYLRAICCNRLMWGVENFEEISLRHTKYAPARFLEEARPALNSFADGSSMKLVEGVAKAKDAKIASEQQEAVDFIMSRGFTRKRTDMIIEAVEREEQRNVESIWDVVNGITAVARDIPFADERTAFEREAKKLLDRVA